MKKDNNIGCGIISFIVLMIVVVGIGITLHKQAQEDSNISASSPPAWAKDAKVPGLTVEAKADVMLAKTKDLYNEMFNYIATSNNQALVRMIQNGQVVVIKKGTKMNIIDRTLTGTLKLEVVSGEADGVQGFLPEEMVN